MTLIIILFVVLLLALVLLYQSYLIAKMKDDIKELYIEVDTTLDGFDYIINEEIVDIRTMAERAYRTAICLKTDIEMSKKRNKLSKTIKDQNTNDGKK